MTDVRERSIFLEALAKATEEDRQEYLDSACGRDSALRDGVEQLLRAHDETGDLLDAMDDTGNETSLFQEYIESASVIGPYRLIKNVGEGGMGAVFLADQTEPFQRQVAVKIIHPRMFSRHGIDRFKSERQLLARMDHPFIAKIFDGGETENGLPYFAMEYVEGEPLTEYCDNKRLCLADRLRLFANVCAAMQHAHQKAIIHRDLKPSNMIIAEVDGQPSPKVIDFGLAKPLGTSLLAYDRGGTVAYMSPEQSDDDCSNVDTRSDIYSLGVVLYELLTGTTPFEKDRLKKEDRVEALRIVREETAPQPSHRLRTMDQLPSLARNRSTTPRRLTAAIQGDLDAIVSKCVKKDPALRYENAGDLRADVFRFLSCRPVAARSPSALYVGRKFAQRHRIAMAVAALVAASLLSAAIAGSALAVHLQRSYQQARRFTSMFIRATLGDYDSNPHRYAKDVGKSWREAGGLLEDEEAAKTEVDLRTEAVAKLAQVGFEQLRSVDLTPRPRNLRAAVVFAPDLRHYVIQDEDDNSLKYVEFGGDAMLPVSKPLGWRSALRFLGSQYVSARKTGAKMDDAHLSIYQIPPDARDLRPKFERANARAHDMLDGRLAFAVAEKGTHKVYVQSGFDPGAEPRVLAVTPPWPSLVLLRPRHSDVLILKTRRSKARRVEAIETLVWNPDLSAKASRFHPEPLFRGAIRACWTADGRHLATASDDGWIQIWEFDAQRLVREWKASGNVITGLRFDPSEEFLAMSGWENRTKLFALWDGRSGYNEADVFVDVIRSGSSYCQFAADGGFAVADGTRAVQHQLLPSKIYQNIVAQAPDSEGAFNFVHSVSVSPDDKVLMMSGDDWVACREIGQHVDWWRKSTGAGRRSFIRPCDASSAVVTSSASIDLVSFGSGSGPSEPVASLKVDDGGSAPFFSHMSRIVQGRFAAVSGRHHVGVFEVGNGSIKTVEGPFEFETQVNSLDLSPDGRWLAIGGRPESGSQTPVLILDLETGGPATVRSPQGDGMNQWRNVFGQKLVAFDPQEPDLLVVGTATSYTLLKQGDDAWTAVKEFPGGNPFPAAAFSGGGRYLALVDKRRRIELRQAPQYDVVVRLTDPYSRRVGALNFDSVGDNLFVAGDGGVRHWKLDALQDELAEAGLDWRAGEPFRR